MGELVLELGEVLDSEGALLGALQQLREAGHLQRLIRQALLELTATTDLDDQQRGKNGDQQQHETAEPQ